MIVGDDSVPVSGNNHTVHAALDHLELFKVQDHASSLQISWPDVFAHGHCFVNFAIGLGVVGKCEIANFLLRHK